MITGQTKLYTEMVVESTINHTKDLDRFLTIAGPQRPVACQLGGNDPDRLARAAKIAESYGYDEINLNVGCPSPRVAVRYGRRLCYNSTCCPRTRCALPHLALACRLIACRCADCITSVCATALPSTRPPSGGGWGGGIVGVRVLVGPFSAHEVSCCRPLPQGSGCFGARLMMQPELVRDCCAAMISTVSVPVTVKCRLGADDMDSYPEFARFVEIVSSSGVRHFIVHARKCWLNGLSPHQNRTIPPLRYDWVLRAAYDFPALQFSLNGGIKSITHARELLAITRDSYEASGAQLVDLGSLRPEPKVAAPKAGAGKAAVGAAGEEVDGASEEAAAAPVSVSVPAAGAGAGAGVDAAVAVSAVTSATSDDSGDKGCSGGGGCDAEASVEQKWTPDDSERRDDRYTYPPPVVVDWDTAALGRGLLNSIMIGRFACSNPWDFWYAGAAMLVESSRAVPWLIHTCVLPSVINRMFCRHLALISDVDRQLFGVPNPGLSRRELIGKYLEYADSLQATDEARAKNTSNNLAKPLLRLFMGCRSSKNWRRSISETLTANKVRL
jgi:tRNA-dihydrouridine synthase